MSVSIDFIKNNFFANSSKIVKREIDNEMEFEKISKAREIFFFLFFQRQFLNLRILMIENSFKLISELLDLNFLKRKDIF